MKLWDRLANPLKKPGEALIVWYIKIKVRFEQGTGRKLVRVVCTGLHLMSCLEQKCDLSLSKVNNILKS